MAGIIEKAANIAILATCALLSFVLLQQYRTTARAGPNPSIPAFKPGDSVAGLLDIDFGAAEKTLVVAIRSGCVYCKKSMPFYRDLIEERVQRGAHIRVVAAAPKGDIDCADYLNAEHLQTDALVFFDVAKFRISGTPTLVLVDKNSQVVESWLGQLSSAREDELWRRLFGTSRTKQKRGQS